MRQIGGGYQLRHASHCNPWVTQHQHICRRHVRRSQRGGLARVRTPDFARSIFVPRSRYGQTLCCALRRLVFGLQYNASTPMRFIRVRTRRRPTALHGLPGVAGAPASVPRLEHDFRHRVDASYSQGSVRSHEARPQGCRCARRMECCPVLSIRYPTHFPGGHDMDDGVLRNLPDWERGQIAEECLHEFALVRVLGHAHVSCLLASRISPISSISPRCPTGRPICSIAS
jgi:hypothetical protein